MADANITMPAVAATGEGYCAGGSHPDPPLDAYPLLAWTESHPRFGRMVVHLEDDAASVRDVAVAMVETPSLDAVASRLGTTVAHVEQAARYAAACGFPSAVATT